MKFHVILVVLVTILFVFISSNCLASAASASLNIPLTDESVKTISDTEKKSIDIEWRTK